ncbi:MAG TPA: hypothetical protein VKV03_07200 [Candidatus Binataceae bacterium]|nr:hypothetical protein [Candidatus Binataceae bacterium]
MTQTPPRDEPALSVILTTDRRETIRGVLRRLQQQTAQARMEIIMVVPRGQGASFGEGDARGFADFRIIEMDNFQPLWKARGAGVRAATAPLVFMGETHAFPHPQWAEALIAANQRGNWGAISPAFGNANPRGALSWAAFIADYGPWIDGMPAGEIDAAPLFNSAYSKSALLELGDRLDPAMAQGDELPATLRSRGYRAYFAAEARIDHVNVTQPKAWLREIFFTGRVIGGLRARRWSRLQRVAYVVGSPLIPFVLSYRLFVRLRSVPGTRLAPAGTFPLIFLGNIIRAAGEMVGYAAGVRTAHELLAEEYELHKMAYAGRREA